MSDHKILPSILAADHGKFISEVETVDIAEVDFLHVDIMDGHFVPNFTFGPQVVRSLKKHTRFKLDVHLMIENVDNYIPDFAAAGADIITIHQEAAPHLQRSLSLIREHGAKPGVAVNPATPIETLKWVLKEVRLVLIMTVNPGFGGQKFLHGMLDKIAALKAEKERHSYSFAIEVDGGINTQTAPLVVDAGAEFLVAGNSVFSKSDRPAAVKEILSAIEIHRQNKGIVYT